MEITFDRISEERYNFRKMSIPKGYACSHLIGGILLHTHQKTQNFKYQKRYILVLSKL